MQMKISMKKQQQELTSNPWEALDEEVKAGATVKGHVVNIEDYGAFLEIIPGVKGLILVPEVTWSNRPINARTYFKLNQEYKAKVTIIDRADKRMYLSIKQLREDPWNEIEEKYPIGSRHTGLVFNLVPFGVFVELEEGIGGLIQIADFFWTKEYTHPSEFVQKGQKIEAVILKIEINNRKLFLGYKQIEENRQDTSGSI